jgi:hypothetical protein
MEKISRSRLQECMFNLDSYLATLQDSRICFMRIIIDHEQKPVITTNTVQKRFRVEGIDEDLYIVRYPSGYCDIYRKSTKKGNHMTVGLIINYESTKLVLISYASSFVHSCFNDDPPTRVQLSLLECNTVFDDDLNAETACVQGAKRTKSTMGYMYCEIGKDPALVQIVSAMKHIYEGTGRSAETAAIEKRKYLQREHDFDTENGTAFKTDFAEFVRDVAVCQVLQLRPELSSVVVMYDGDMDEIMIMFNYGDEDMRLADQFFVDTDLARNAYVYETIGETSRAALESAQLEKLRDARHQFGQMFLTVESWF